jgi:hypothetical protein
MKLIRCDAMLDITFEPNRAVYSSHNLAWAGVGLNSRTYAKKPLYSVEEKYLYRNLELLISVGLQRFFDRRTVTLDVIAERCHHLRDDWQSTLPDITKRGEWVFAVGRDQPDDAISFNNLSVPLQDQWDLTPVAIRCNGPVSPQLRQALRGLVEKISWNVNTEKYINEIMESYSEVEAVFEWGERETWFDIAARTTEKALELAAAIVMDINNIVTPATEDYEHTGET